MRVTTADHAIRRVRDLEASLGFYRDALGSEPFDLEEYRRGERPPSILTGFGELRLAERPHSKGIEVEAQFQSITDARVLQA